MQLSAQQIPKQVYQQYEEEMTTDNRQESDLHILDIESENAN